LETLGGRHAAEYIKKVKHGKLDLVAVEEEYERITAPFSREKGCMPAEIQDELREVMWQKVSIERNEKVLSSGLKEFKKIVDDKLFTMSLKGGLHYNPGWLDYMDVLNMVVVCEGIISSALFRKESRGAHKRTDFLEMLPEWHVNIICELKGGEMKLSTRKIPEISEEIKGWLESKK